MLLPLSFPLRSAFLALPLEGEAVLRFQEVQKKLVPFEKLFRFQQPDRPHLTLFYWQSLMEIEYEGMVKQLQKIAQKTRPFTLDVTEAGTFSGEKLPRVLFLGVTRSAELSDLKKRCPWPNLKPFTPHITLSRMKNPQAFLVHRKDIMKALKNIFFMVPCDRLRFYADIDGVKQTPIQDFVFKL